MAEDTVPALLAPSQPPECEIRIRSISEKPKKRKIAPGNGTAPRSRQLSDEQILESSDDKSQIDDTVQRLVEVSRGVGLILSSFHDYPMPASTAWGLGEALREAAEAADAYYFKSLGDLNDSIPERLFSVLLKRELKAVRVKIAEGRKRGGPANE